MQLVITIKKLRRYLSCSCLLLLTMLSLPALTQDSAAPAEIKSAFLLTFFDYFTWQQESNIDELVVGVVGPAREVLDTLRQASVDRNVRGKPIQVMDMNSAEQFAMAHILYVSPDYQQMSQAEILLRTKQTNTLVVSDDNPDTVNTMINLVVDSVKGIFFEVNKPNITYEGLEMDNAVLLLGGTEMDVASLFRATEEELFSARGQLLELEKQFQLQNEELLTQGQKLLEQSQHINRLSREINEREERLQGLETDRQQAVDQLALAQQDITASNRVLQQQERLLTERNAELQEQSQQSGENKQLLATQKAEIDNQNLQLGRQRQDLAEQVLLVDNYLQINRMIIMALGLFILLSALLVLVNRKRTFANALLARQNVVLESAKQELAFERDRADRANEAKSRFLTNLSHEIRSPMNAILGYSELLELQEHADMGQKKFLEAIQRNGKHLLSLINDVLDMAKISSGKMELENRDFDLIQLLDDIDIMFRGNAVSKGLEFSIDIDSTVPEHVRGDEGKLRQVLVNLLSNAIKYTPAGEVAISVMAEATLEFDSLRPNYSLVFRIKDSGVGIKPEDHDKVFGVFEQSSDQQQSIEGTGLGLAISRHYSQMMKGDITVESEQGQGSVFIFSCEVDKAGSDVLPGRSQKVVQAIAGVTAEFKILIVDDLKENQDLLMQILAPMGFKLQLAANGVEAVSFYQEWLPHIILMDLRMPIMDGYEASSQITALAKASGHQVKIVAVTANAFDEDRTKIGEYGMEKFISKPFTKSEILQTLSDLLELQAVYESDLEVVKDRKLDVTVAKKLIARLPAGLRKDMQLAVRNLDVEGMQTLVGDLDDELVSLRSYLGELLEDFRFDVLDNLFGR